MRGWLGVAAMLAALAVAAYVGLGKPAKQRPRLPSSSPSAVEVSTTVVGETAGSGELRLAGLVRSHAESAITPKVPARIRTVHVRNGDVVKLGAPLVSLDMGDMRAQIAGARAGLAAAEAVLRKAIRGRAARSAEMDGAAAQAEGGVGIAQAKLRQAELGVPLASSAAQSDADRAGAGVRQAEAGLRQAEAGLKEAEATVARLEVLHRHGGISEADLSGARTQAAMARAGLEAAQAGHDLALAAARPAAESVKPRKEVSEADLAAARAGAKLAADGLRVSLRAKSEALAIADQDIAAARAQVRQAEAGVRQAEAAIGAETLVSPVAGVVTKASCRPGEYAQPGLALMRIVSTAATDIEVSVPVAALTDIAVGTSAEVVMGPSRGPHVAAVVTEVSPVASSDGRAVPVRLRVVAAHAQLRPGALVGVTIARRGGLAWSVPRSAVLTSPSGSSVFVARDGRACRKAARVRRTIGDEAEVLADVRPGDRIIAPVPDGLADGQAVREMGR